MRIVVTDTGKIWNHKNPILERFKDIVLVVTIGGNYFTGKYECCMCPTLKRLDNEAYLISKKNSGMEYIKKYLIKSFNYHEDIIFLSDMEPSTLYPYYAIKDTDTTNTYHLCTISPFNYEDADIRKRHNELLADTNSLQSLLYMDSNAYIADGKTGETEDNLLNKMSLDFEKMMPRIINGVKKMHAKSYFDFASKSYVPLKKGFKGINLSLANNLEAEKLERIGREFSTLGLYCTPSYPSDDNNVKKHIESLPPRIDGKKICNYLRAQRLALAKANNIEFKSEECPSVGACAGTCVKCEQESQFLRKELNKIPVTKQKIPNFKLVEWEV